MRSVLRPLALPTVGEFRCRLTAAAAAYLSPRRNCSQSPVSLMPVNHGCRAEPSHATETNQASFEQNYSA